MPIRFSGKRPNPWEWANLSRPTGKQSPLGRLTEVLGLYLALPWFVASRPVPAIPIGIGERYAPRHREDAGARTGAGREAAAP